MGIDYLGQNKSSSFVKAVGIGLDLVSQVIGCIVIGALIGYLLDRWLNTTPVFLMIFIVLGVMAAFRNAYVIAMRL